ncbi:primosomal protein N' [Bryobacter aggregatus]|uniref:primosomal protein N' n=1 Tax=Bryobacter aggregatus TaxID=360054 RepID=UPI0004E28028|nr:primosomal protein N' [Bryobacter aggregatus]
MALFCDVCLPVPLDQPFTYALSGEARDVAQPGCRVLVPFQQRKLSGTILRIHDEKPDYKVRPIERLLDQEPVFDSKLISLGLWVARYYYAPVGEVFRIMAPLGGEIRRSKAYGLTDTGRDMAKQSLLGIVDQEDASLVVLQALESRPMSLEALKRKSPEAPALIREFLRKGYVRMEEEAQEKDPLRAHASKLNVEMLAGAPEGKLPKWERELLAYLHLHPGVHPLDELEDIVKNASQSARSLARRQLVKLTPRVGAIRRAAERPRHALNASQQAAYQAIEAGIQRKDYQAFLLQGVTGSGKTEVYLSAIEAALAMGRSALLMVPEIALTPQVAGQFALRFGEQVAILHSAFGDSERAEYWRRIRRGEARVVVGTRSSIFAPMPDLGLIIVDEEHDGSYKQEENPRYHGRDVAVVRAQQIGATVVLGSATPSLETRQNSERGKYVRLLLPERIEQRPMPAVEVIDLRQEFLETKKNALFSRRMVEAVREKLAFGEQAMLLMNRRGYSNFVACRSCGYKVECINCSVTLTFHRRDRRLLCHYCGYAEKVPVCCAKCDSEHIQFIGSGSERIEEELREAFPKARIARMDRDTINSKADYEHILHGFREGNFDILVGTQMIAKGHDIPNVTLVGIVNADIGLGMPDFRAAERSFQLLTQAAGRAGRGGLPGTVILQTINTEHYAIRFSAIQDYELFYEKELQFRKVMRYPPFASLANVVIRSERQEEALRMSGEIGEVLKDFKEGIRILGPAEAPVPRVNKEFRYQMLLKAAQRKRLGEALDRVRACAVERNWPATALVIDVDPQSLL